MAKEAKKLQRKKNRLKAVETDIEKRGNYVFF